jgi:hypothetical protein
VSCAKAGQQVDFAWQLCAQVVGLCPGYLAGGSMLLCEAAAQMDSVSPVTKCSTWVRVGAAAIATTAGKCSIITRCTN